MKRHLLLGALGLLLLLPVAASHATPARTFPAAGERLAVGPAEIWVEFSERVERETVLALVDARGEVREVGPTTVRGSRASAPVQPLPEGGYLVQWYTISAVDGHETSGAWGFAVGNATAPATPAVAEPPLEAGAVLGKAIAFGGLALLVGALVFRLFIHPEDPHHIERWGAAAQLLGLLLFATAQGSANPKDLADYLSQTEFGRGLMVRLLLALALLVLTLPSRLAEARSVQGLRLALASILILAYAAASHGAGYGGPLGTALDAVHLAAVCTWSGALALLVLVLRAPVPPAPALRRIVDRFSALAVACVAVAVVTGSALTLRLLGGPKGWQTAAETQYGVALALKIVLAFAMIGFGAVNRWVHVRALRRAQGFDRPEFASNARREVVVALAVFLMAGVATNLSPVAPVEPSSPPFSIELEGTDHRFRVEVDPAPSPGNVSTFRVTVREKGSDALVDDAIRVRLTFQPPDPDLSPVEFLVEPVGGGTYESTGAFLFAPGTWGGVVFVQTPRTFRDSAEFGLAVV